MIGEFIGPQQAIGLSRLIFLGDTAELPGEPAYEVLQESKALRIARIMPPAHIADVADALSVLSLTQVGEQRPLPQCQKAVHIGEAKGGRPGEIDAG